MSSRVRVPLPRPGRRGGHSFRQPPLVNEVSCGRQGPFPATGPAGLLHAGDPGQGIGQVPLVEHLAHLGEATTGHEDLRRGGGPSLEPILSLPKLLGQVTVHGEALFRQLYGRADHVPEAHGPIPA